MIHRVYPENRADWAAYHNIRRTVLWEARGRSNYDTDHPDESKNDHYPLLFTADGEPVGTVRVDVRREAKEAIFRLVAITLTEQGKGFGRQMMIAAEHFAKEQSCNKFIANAAPDAVPFYTKLGYIFDDTSAENDPKNPRMIKNGIRSEGCSTK